MKRKLQDQPGRTGTESLTVHLGYEGIDLVDRCSQMLQEGSLSSRRISRSEVVRVAVRRLCLAILADRARPDNPDCQYMREYLRILSAASEAVEYPVPLDTPIPAIEPEGEGCDDPPQGKGVQQ